MHKILLVEDERDFRNLLSSFIEMQGFKVITAADGIEGWEKFNSESPDLCLLDVMLPKKDGFSLGTEIKKANPEMWVIFLPEI